MKNKTKGAYYMIKSAKELAAEEKMRLICGKDFWHTDDLGGKLPRITVADGPVGLRMVKERREDGTETSYPAVAYPSIQLLANTWSTASAKEMGMSLGDDCIERDVDILLAPGVNIKRNPLNGRNFEYFSEDPYLAGTMAKSYIEGVQGRGAGVCLKHFCCNNLEYDRLHQSSDVDERTLREIYYKPFKIACEAKPVSVMCSYNRINGTYAAEYKRGFDVLRDEFGFDGAIFSDWGAVRDRTVSAKAGLDLSMPVCEEHFQKLRADYAAGRLTDEELDRCAQRVLDLIARCKKMRAGKRAETTEKKRAEVAKMIAAEGMVLLKNDGLLPLRGKKTVSVSGCFAKPDTIEMLRGGGSAGVEWLDKTFDLPAALGKRGYAVAYEGAFRYDGVESFHQNTRTALLNAAERDVAVVCVGTGNPVEYEAGDRRSLRLPDVQERAVLETAEQNENTVVIVFAGGAVDMSAWADKAKAILYAGFPGMGGDEVIADILSGKINPSGKLSETFPLCEDTVPAVNACRVAGVTRYQEGLDVGYRYFDTYDVPVLFPFGHGLSYSQFVYKGMALEKDDGGLEISCSVENTSARDGKECVQVYVRERAPLVYRQKKELKAFAKAEIGAGECATFAFRLDSSAFAHWSVSENGWTVTDGVYEILVGASSQDIRLRAKVRIEKGKIEVL